jgi:hypothetical protein
MIQELFIGGLPCSATDERLHELFATAGSVESAAVTLKVEIANSAGSGGAERGGGSGSRDAIRG